MPAAKLSVEVAYATAAKQQVWQVKVRPGSTIADAIAAAKVCDVFPELDLAKQPVGIFSRQRSLDTQVSAGDRVEIYRPLPEHPNHSRVKRLK